jgi:hypothetical protein
MSKKGVFSKGVVIGVIVLFIGIAVQPSIATVPIDDEIDEDAKEYLFQTIIDIANHPDVKDYVKQNSHNMFTSDFDFKGLYSELLVKNPILLPRLRVIRPTLTHGYLDKIHNIGIEMIDILGEEQVYEIVDTIVVSNTEFYEGLNNIVLNDEELTNRINTQLDLLRIIVCYSLLAIFIPVFFLYLLYIEITTLIWDSGFHSLCYILDTIVGYPLLCLNLILLALIIGLCFEPVPNNN